MILHAIFREVVRFFHATFNVISQKVEITLGQCATVFNDAQSKILYRHM